VFDHPQRRPEGEGEALSYEVWIDSPGHHGPRTTVVEVGSYSSKCDPMWTAALDGTPLSAFHDTACSDAAGPLAAAVQRMEADPDRYRAMGPPDGPGTYGAALAFLRQVAEACAQHPTCRLGIWA
jgi:hypothetical protein